MTEEQIEIIREAAKDGVETWAKEMFCGPIMQELINGQTELIYIMLQDLRESDKAQVKKIVKEVMTKEFVNYFKKF